MGQLYIPGKKEIKGPWFIGVDELEELDKIIEYIDTKIIESKYLEINESTSIDIQKYPSIYKDLETGIATRKESYLENHVKKIILISSDEKRLTDTSIKGILKDPKLKDFKPKELEIEIGYRSDNSFSLNVKRRYDEEISYEVKCFDQDCRDEIKYKIEYWT